MFDPITIESHRGPYTVNFVSTDGPLVIQGSPDRIYIIDTKVAGLYPEALALVLDRQRYLLIDALEDNKSLEVMPQYIEALVTKGVKRSDTLVAIGGGIIQDITCFLASTLLRGIAWEFIPTTLLSQCDSCIGSKSSINCGSVKNILGTFNPPQSITIAPHFLQTLSHDEIRSGIGEMIKVHIIAGYDRFFEIAAIYSQIEHDPAMMLRMIRASLLIKKEVIELDEFDQGIRNVMNYGHSFGHALESASHYAIPHGIAVTIGMDIANWIAMGNGRLSQEKFETFRKTLLPNYAGYQATKLDLDQFFAALSKDKKRISEISLNAIIPDASGRPERFKVTIDGLFKEKIQDFFKAYGFDNFVKKEANYETESQGPAASL